MVSRPGELAGRPEKGFRGRPGGQQVWSTSNTLPPKILGFSQNSLINHSIHSHSWFWKFGKKILKRKFGKKKS
jgi:hypothetical protein